MRHLAAPLAALGLLGFFAALGVGGRAPRSPASARPAAPSPPTQPPSASSTAPEPTRAARALAVGARLRAEALPPAFARLVSAAVPKPLAAEGEWLAEHEEQGQTVAAHAARGLDVRRRVIYLQPAGLAPADEPLLAQLEAYTAAWFQLPVRRLEPLPAARVSKHARERPWGTQWLAAEVIDALVAERPVDAAAVMAVTSVDLYPDPDWNFVFGQASYEERVGVTSLFRVGDEQPRRTRRAAGTTVHELGHMLGLAHCLAWVCAMNGSNSQDESGAAPLEPCPHCLAKLAAATGLDVEARRRAVERALRAADLSP